MARSPLRLGVIGCANVARQFIAAVAPSETVKVVAVASRDAAKAERFARETGVARSHGSYAALLADRDVDAVYNPLPNSLHAEWSIKAAEAGKHILCEKPLSATGAEARAMFAAARKAGVHMVEAYPYLAHPQTLKLRELLDAGAIGAVRMIRASIGFTVFDPATNVRFSAPLAGGALYDCGTYPVSLALLAAREKPARVHATAQWAPSGVDQSLMAMLEFRSGIMAQISCSLVVGSHRHALITGDGGVIETSFLNHAPLGGPPVLHVKQGNRSDTPNETITTAGGNGFRLEAESFARLVAGDAGAWTGVSEQQSIDIMDTLEAIRRSAHVGAAVDLPR